jgi:protein-tyrosine phosphatase
VIDFSAITPRLGTGGQLNTYVDAEQLVLAGYTHSIDLTWDEADQSIMASHPLLSVLWNPTEDDGQHKEPSWFKQSIDFAFMALAQPNTKVYCHCKDGHNRGPSTCLAIMMATGWDFDVAIDLIHTQRPATYGMIRYAVDAANAVKELGYT